MTTNPITADTYDEALARLLVLMDTPDHPDFDALAEAIWVYEQATWPLEQMSAADGADAGSSPAACHPRERK